MAFLHDPEFGQGIRLRLGRASFRCLTNRTPRKPDTLIRRPLIRCPDSAEMSWKADTLIPLPDSAIHRSEKATEVAEDTEHRDGKPDRHPAAVRLAISLCVLIFLCGFPSGSRVWPGNQAATSTGLRSRWLTTPKPDTLIRRHPESALNPLHPHRGAGSWAFLPAPPS